jgi:hypothetical protein
MAPFLAPTLRMGEIRPRKTPANPQPHLIFDSHLIQAETSFTLTFAWLSVSRVPSSTRPTIFADGFAVFLFSLKLKEGIADIIIFRSIDIPLGIHGQSPIIEHFKAMRTS